MNKYTHKTNDKYMFNINEKLTNDTLYTITAIAANILSDEYFLCIQTDFVYTYFSTNLYNFLYFFWVGI